MQTQQQVADQVNSILDQIAKLAFDNGSTTDALIDFLQLAAKDRLTGLQNQHTKGEQLAQKFPKAFKALRKGTKYSATDLWNDMQIAGITEENLPAMEQAIVETEIANALPGHKFFQLFADYWG